MLGGLRSGALGGHGVGELEGHGGHVVTDLEDVGGSGCWEVGVRGPGGWRVGGVSRGWVLWVLGASGRLRDWGVEWWGRGKGLGWELRDRGGWGCQEGRELEGQGFDGLSGLVDLGVSGSGSPKRICFAIAADGA